MRKLWLSGIMLAGFSSVPAIAADLAIKAAPFVPPPPAFSWTGFYVGATGGYGWGTGDQTAGVGSANFLVPFSTGGGLPGKVAPVDMKGGIAGGQIGYNYQIANWVFGLEASAAWADIEGSTTTQPLPLTSTVTWTSKLNWQATATPRIGWAWNQWLFYGKGGLAAGGANVSVAQISGTGGAFAATQQRVGWTAGAGIEYALNHNWIVGVEYDFVDLGTENYAGFGTTSTGNSRFFSEDVKLNYSEVLARLSYKFDWK